MLISTIVHIMVISSNLQEFKVALIASINPEPRTIICHRCRILRRQRNQVQNFNLIFIHSHLADRSLLKDQEPEADAAPAADAEATPS